MRFEIKSGTWTCFFTDFLALGNDSICLFRICFQLFCTSGRRFRLLKSSPARGLVSLQQILARGNDLSCLFRPRSNILYTSGGRFWILKSSPARGLVSLQISVPSDLFLLAFSGSVSRFFTLLGVDFAFLNQVRHVDLFLYRFPCPRN